METNTSQPGYEEPSANSSKSATWSPRLLGVTATGPVFNAPASFVIIPFASGCMLLRELAAKVDNPHAPVVSSLAKRVSGDDAYRAWFAQSVQLTALLPSATKRGRLAFLRNTMNVVRRVGHVDGLEPVLAAAVNAAWPWLSTTSTDRVLEYSTAMLGRSKFAQQHAVPVLDATSRTISKFAPGGLSKLDLAEWRTKRYLDQDEFISGRDGLGPRGGNLPGRGGLDALIDQLFGGGTSGSLDDLAAGLLGDDSSGVPGGLPSAGDLPGRGRGSRGSASNPSLDDIAAGLLGDDSSGVPGGLPSAGDLPGRGRGSRSDSPSDSTLGGLLGSIPGSEYKGISGWIESHGVGGFKAGGFADATPGGPFAPTGRLGTNGGGGEGWNDGVRDIATGVGLASTAIAAVLVIPATIGAAAQAGVLGAAIVGLAAAGALIGLGVAEIDESRQKNDPPPEKPHSGDLYPDPDGGGGGGNPTQLPDQEGGGGRPNTIWDENGGGGTPNTIWDDNFGGPGPTVKPETFTVYTLAGSGLNANIVQISPSTLRF